MFCASPWSASDDQRLIQELDVEVKRRMTQLAAKVDPAVRPLSEARNPGKTPRRTEPLDLRTELYRAFAVDLRARKV